MTALPTLDTVLDRTRALLPALTERIAETQESRRIPAATIRDFQKAGVFKVNQPKRLGGYDLDYGAQVFVAGEIGRACASSAWIATVVASHHWVCGLFPAEAQDDIWAKNPDAIVCSAYAHESARAVPERNGYRLSGHWHFASGIDSADWVILLALVAQDSGPPRRTTVLVPRADFEIVDTWRSTGLRGTGTNDVIVRDAFVPGWRELDFPAANSGQAPGTAANTNPIYRLPMMGVGPFTVVGPVTGVAESALDLYVRQTGGRLGILSDKQLGEHANLQLRVAESSAEIECANLLLRADLADVNRRAHAGEPIPQDVQLRYKRNVAYAALLCRRATDRLVMAMGVTGQREDNPIQLKFRDLNALASHGVMAWDQNALPFGRHAFGIDLPSPYR